MFEFFGELEVDLVAVGRDFVNEFLSLVGEVNKLLFKEDICL